MHVLLLTSAYKNKFNPINALFFYDQAKALLQVQKDFNKELISRSQMARSVSLT